MPLRLHALTPLRTPWRLYTHGHYACTPLRLHALTPPVPTEGKTHNQIAELQKRDPKTVRKALKPKKTLKPKGRPPMSAADFAKCDKALVKMQRQVKANKEITATMVAKKAGVKYGEKCVRKWLASHGKPFRKLREKPQLTPEDVETRLAFSKRNYLKTKAG